MNYKSTILAVSALVVSLGGVVYAQSPEDQTTRRFSTKEEVCLHLLAKADEKAQDQQAYTDKINEVIENLTNFQLPEGTDADTQDIDAKKAEALAKANELKVKLESVFAQYEAVRPTIDCSDPEDALAKVKEARSNVQGGSFVSKYVGDINIAQLNAEAKTVRAQTGSVFGSLVRK